MSSIFGSLLGFGGGLSSSQGDAMSESAINAAASDYEKKAAALNLSTYQASQAQKLVQVPPTLQQKAAMASAASQAAMQAAYAGGMAGVWLDANGNLQSGLAAAGLGHMYRHPSDIYGGFRDVEMPSYTTDNVKNCTCIDYDRDEIVKNEISTANLMDVYGGKYTGTAGAQVLHLGGIPSLCTISYDVPSKIKWSYQVAASGAIDGFITSIRFCTKICCSISGFNSELFGVSKYISWKVCKTDDGMLEVSSSICDMESLMAAICRTNIENAHT